MKTSENVAATTQNKIEIIFEIHFLFSLIVFMNNIEKFVYFLSIDDDEIVIRREIMKIVYKINFNKIINKTLRQLARIVIEQIYFLFDKCIKESIQLSHFKRVFIIMLRKSNKKITRNYHRTD